MAHVFSSLKVSVRCLSGSQVLSIMDNYLITWIWKNNDLATDVSYQRLRQGSEA